MRIARLHRKWTPCNRKKDPKLSGKSRTPNTIFHLATNEMKGGCLKSGESNNKKTSMKKGMKQQMK